MTVYWICRLLHYEPRRIKVLKVLPVDDLYGVPFGQYCSRQEINSQSLKTVQKLYKLKTNVLIKEGICVLPVY